MNVLIMENVLLRDALVIKVGGEKNAILEYLLME
jgi:hypothetical protein